MWIYDMTLANQQSQDILMNIKDPTYSPLALYFILDNNLLSNQTEINQYFDVLINETPLE